eukprot:818553-Prorocentrum_minimum.AAC.1
MSGDSQPENVTPPPTHLWLRFSFNLQTDLDESGVPRGATRVKTVTGLVLYFCRRTRLQLVVSWGGEGFSSRSWQVVWWGRESTLVRTIEAVGMPLITFGVGVNFSDKGGYESSRAERRVW